MSVVVERDASLGAMQCYQSQSCDRILVHNSRSALSENHNAQRSLGLMSTGSLGGSRL